jgi:peptide deformylase
MVLRKIFTYPESVLRQRAEPVTDIDGRLQELIDDMADTMYQAPGIGLAANQVGETCRVIVFDTSAKGEPKNLCVVINPEIVEASGTVVNEEGCLSVVDYCAEVTRAECITVKGMNREGDLILLQEEGLPAIVLQHEIDHLNGTLFIDHISKLKRELYKRKLRKQLKERESASPKL